MGGTTVSLITSSSSGGTVVIEDEDNETVPDSYVPPVVAIPDAPGVEDEEDVINETVVPPITGDVIDDSDEDYSYQKIEETSNLMAWIIVIISCIVIIVTGSIIVYIAGKKAPIPDDPTHERSIEAKIVVKEYIRKCKKLGYENQQIRFYLLQQGYPSYIVEGAFLEVTSESVGKM